MIKFNFFTPDSTSKLAKALSLFTQDKLTYAARSRFNEIDDVYYDHIRDIVLISDAKGVCIAPDAECASLDLWLNDSTLADAINIALGGKDSASAIEIWDAYAPILDIETKVRFLRLLEGYIGSDSFSHFKPFIDYSDQIYDNMIIYRNTYDSAILSGSSFRNSHITCSSFRGTYLERVDFSGCVLEHVDFTGAIISPETKLDEAVLIGTTLPKLPKLFS